MGSRSIFTYLRFSTVCLASLALMVSCGRRGQTLDDGEEEPNPWSQVAGEADGGWLLDAWGRASGDRVIVGGRPGEGLVLRGSGDTLSPDALPESPGLLRGVQGFSDGTIVAVGEAGVILRWEGGQWQTEPSPTDQDLHGVWGPAPDTLWAVGGNGTDAGQATILHYREGAWEVVTLPPIARTGVFAFYGVWGSASDDIYAVGQWGVILRFDGTAWEDLVNDGTEHLYRIWGTSSDDVVAVGGTDSATIAVWNGFLWRHTSFADLPGPARGVWSATRREATLAVANGLVATIDLYDLIVLSREAATEGVDFEALVGVRDDWLLAVGGNRSRGEETYMGAAFLRSLAPEE